MHRSHFDGFTCRQPRQQHEETVYNPDDTTELSSAYRV